MEFRFVPPDRNVHEANRFGSLEKHAAVTGNRVFSEVQLL